MAGTGYSVASAAQLFGGKKPKRREADEVYFGRMKAIDRSNRDKSALKRQDHVRTIRFRPAGADGGQQMSGEDRASSSADLSSEDSTASSSSASGTTANVKDATKRPVIVEFPARVKELQAETTLPAKHSERIAKTARIDTSGTPTITIETTGLSRSSSKRSKRDSQDIFFSPIDVNKSQISLSDPIEDPDEVLTLTQERYDEQLRADKGHDDNQQMPKYPPRSDKERDETILLTPTRVDRLVKALAECPLLHCHVSRQWWDDVSDDATTSSEETPSLTSDSGSDTLYSHPNKNFCDSPRRPSVTQAILEEEFAQSFPNHPKAKHPTAHAAAAARSTKFGGIALADPKVHGTPIRFITKNYRLGANVLKVGACSFLNIPYGTTVQSNLRIEPPSSVSSNARVMLQVVNQVLERKTGRKTYLLSAELDVTESFTNAALTELSEFAGVSPDDIQVITPAEKPKHHGPDVDWCALANEFETSCAVTSTVEKAASSFAKLTTDTCSMKTLTLMSQLERLKVQHQDFLVARPTGHHQNGMVSGINMPWISQHLDAMLLDGDSSNARGERSARVLRDRVVTAIAEGCGGDKPFDTRIWWGDQMRLVHCVPLMEGADDSRPAAWVAFLSGECSYLPF